MTILLAILSICLLVIVSGCSNSEDQPTIDPNLAPTNTITPEIDATGTRQAEIGELATIQAERTATEVTKSTGTSTSIAEIVETETPEPTASSTPPASATPTKLPESTLETEIDLAAKLPTLNDLPPGFAMSEDKELTNADLAAGYPDPEAHLDRLNNWGFQKSFYRRFEIPSPGLNDLFERTVLFDCVISHYGSPEQVQLASRFTLDTIKNIENWEIQEVSSESIGDWTLAAQGSDNTGSQSLIRTFVYAQVDDIQYQCTGVSRTHNSMQEVADLVKLMITR